MNYLELKYNCGLQHLALVATVVVLQLLAPNASAQNPETTSPAQTGVAPEEAETRPAWGLGIAESMTIPLYKSGVLRLNQSAARISVGNPDIADILILRSTQLYVLGKDLGTTNVILWDRNDQLIGTVDVEVTHDLGSLKAKLHELLPNDEITVYSSQQNIVLSGQVSNLASMDAALQIAEGYLVKAGTAVDSVEFDQEEKSGDDEVCCVVNLMQIGGGQQVMLEVKVAEIARSELRSIESRMAFLSDSSRWSFGGKSAADQIYNVLPGPTPTPTDRLPLIADSITDKGLFAQYLSDDFLFSLALDAAKTDGLAKILAEPTLTTLTGQQAEFLSGGEFPIPVAQDQGNTTVVFKDFGVGLRFLPVVLGDGVINLKVNISVSELVDNNSLIVGTGMQSSGVFSIPALTKRSAEATYELRDGQTIGVAGLINENLRETITKFPGLGDLPILGSLFRSQSFIKGETELMILITPRLAKPIDPNKLTLPTDSFVEPSDSDFYILGRMEKTMVRDGDNGGADSDFGHQVQ